MIYIKECSMFTSMSFRSLIHLEFIFIYGIRECCSTILLHVAVQFFQQHLIEEGVFPPFYILASFFIDEVIIIMWVYL